MTTSAYWLREIELSDDPDGVYEVRYRRAVEAERRIATPGWLCRLLRRFSTRSHL